MRKFFLFRRQEVSKASTFTSDSGSGVDVFAVAADLLAFMTAEEGAIRLVFNDATPYEDNNLVDGDSMQKTSVNVSCTPGKEVDVIENIMAFMGRDGRETVMKFDAVSGFTNVRSGVSINNVSDIVSQVRKSPVERSTGKVSTRTFIGGTAGTVYGTPNTIQGIDFGSTENKPVIDFNESGITVSTGTDIDGWTNSGTGGTDYDCTTNGTPTKLTTVGRTGSGVSTVAADVTTSQYFILGSELLVGDDYTMYAVVSNNPSDILNLQGGRIFKGNLYGGDDGTSFGFNGELSDAAENLFSIRFNTFTGDPAKSDGNFHQQTANEDEVETFKVIIIRRTQDNVIFIHDASGEIISMMTDGALKGEGVYDQELQEEIQQGSISTNASGRTDGVLAIKNFGGAPNAPEPKGTGHIARFGVIERDIGTEAAATLAQSLYKIYKPIS